MLRTKEDARMYGSHLPSFRAVLSQQSFHLQKCSTVQTLNSSLALFDALYGAVSERHGAQYWRKPRLSQGRMLLNLNDGICYA